MATIDSAVALLTASLTISAGTLFIGSRQRIARWNGTLTRRVGRIYGESLSESVGRSSTPAQVLTIGVVLLSIGVVCLITFLVRFDRSFDYSVLFLTEILGITQFVGSILVLATVMYRRRALPVRSVLRSSAVMTTMLIGAEGALVVIGALSLLVR